MSDRPEFRDLGTDHIRLLTELIAERDEARLQRDAFAAVDVERESRTQAAEREVAELQAAYRRYYLLLTESEAEVAELREALAEIERLGTGEQLILGRGGQSRTEPRLNLQAQYAHAALAALARGRKENTQ